MSSATKARQQFFDDLASTWELSPQFALDQERLRTMISSLPIKAGHCVLDVGTGTGIALKPLLEAVGKDGKIVGIDESEKMVAEALKIHFEVIVGDAHNLEFPPETFDNVFAFSVLPHLDKPERFMRQAATVLRSGGHLIVLHFMSWEVCNDFHRKVDTAVENDMLPTPADLARMAAVAGLQPTRFEEAEDLFLWIARKL